jgi:pyruvate/2-oxoglutarate dehydrogenase complex dihydrolipoamide dehydrogenase (E3) component/anti-anti-sigma regulatory factor
MGLKKPWGVDMGVKYDFDVVVIGAGIGGFVSAVTANSLGKKVAIVEKRKVGGNCTNFTCIPSKALIRASHARKDAAHLERMGLGAHSPVNIDTSNVLPRIRSVIQKAYEKDLPETFREIGIEVLSGEASFVDSHRIVHDCRVISSEKFIIAVGTRPLVPPIAGLADLEYLTNENLYELDALPKSLIILGGGVDGLEYASAFGKLGVDTTVVEMATRLLPMVDRELVNYLLHTLQEEGIRILAGAKAESLIRGGSGVVLTYQRGDGQRGEVTGERVLVSIGRKADVEGLALDKTGVKAGPRGIITNNKLQTSAPNIYACGDIVGPYQLASTAEYQGMIAGTNAVLPIKQRVDYRNNVYVVFTEPQIGYLGLSEEEALRQYGHKLKVYRFDYKNMRRAMVDGTESGMAKFLVDGRGRLVGAHILGEAAAEVIHEAQVVKAFKQPLRKLYSITHAYPTYAQALVGRASQLAFLDRMGDSLFVKKALELLPGLENRLHLARERLAETATLPPVSPFKGSGEEIACESFNDGAVTVVRLPAILVDYNEEQIFAAFLPMGAERNRSLILDFSKVAKMNGLGADMLIKLCARSAMNGWTVSACRLPEGMKDILKVTELDQAMDIFDSEADALAFAGVSHSETSALPNREKPATIDTSRWAQPVPALTLKTRIKGARNLNIEGRRAVGPVNGFGQLWQKIFRLTIQGPMITPGEAVVALKQNFPSFQPSFNRFYPSPAGIKPGEIILIDSMTPGGPVSTGVLVLYADEQSFTFACPEGHPESGFVTFSGHEENGNTIVQILGLARANDPVYEAAFRFVGSKVQGRIWTHVLKSLAAYLGVPGQISLAAACIDAGFQWSQAKNLKYNAQIRTLIKEPLFMLTKLFGDHNKKETRPA